jgi:hypothetical protein
MSFKATLDIGGKSFELMECNCKLQQKYDSSGKPASGVRGGIIDLIMQGSDDDTFYSWMHEPTKKQDGKITLFRIDQESKFKEIEFKNAYIITIAESFIVDEQIGYLDREHMIDSLRIDGMVRINVYQDLLTCQTRTNRSYLIYCELSAEVVKIDGVEHNNKW